MAPRWLIYALGGGAGHITRALALGRAAAKRGVRVTILSNSEHGAWIQRACAAPLRFVLLDAMAREPTVWAVEQVLARESFDRLVVDTFARGLAGELVARLPSLAVPKVLVHRDLDERYVADCDLRASLRHYQLVLLPGERGPLADAPGALYTAPWTVRDRGELLTRSEARKCWGFGDEPGVVVVGGGKRDEHASWRRLAEELRDELRGVATVRLALAGEAHWPLVEWLPGADLIIGGGGYNLVSEARLVGVPLLARALPRRYDPQRRRLRPHERLAADEVS